MGGEGFRDRFVSFDCKGRRKKNNKMTVGKLRYSLEAPLSAAIQLTLVHAWFMVYGVSTWSVLIRLLLVFLYNTPSSRAVSKRVSSMQWIASAQDGQQEVGSCDPMALPNASHKRHLSERARALFLLNLITIRSFAASRSSCPSATHQPVSSERKRPSLPH